MEPEKIPVIIQDLQKEMVDIINQTPIDLDHQKEIHDQLRDILATKALEKGLERSHPALNRLFQDVYYMMETRFAAKALYLEVHEEKKA